MYEELHEYVLTGDSDAVESFVRDALAPVTEEFANQIGADGYAPDAAAAARLASQLAGADSSSR